MPFCVLLAAIGSGGCAPPAGPQVVIGSKLFPESVVLGEMGVRLAQRAGADAQRKGFGSTALAWNALALGEVDAYPEYTGTITREILKSDPPDLAAALAEYGVLISKSLGFRNNYALGMRQDVAAARGIRTVSDLRRHPELRLGFTHEFLDRPDGWPGLRTKYDLPHAAPQGLAHTAGYAALVNGAVDVKEVYTTDGEVTAFRLAVLADDKDFFPTYDAVWLYRADLADRAPAVVEQLLRLEGRISEPDMQRMNGRVQADGAPEPAVAADFLKDKFGESPTPAAADPLAARVLSATAGHLLLVAPSLTAAVLVGVPLGVAAARRPAVGHGVLGAVGVVQTIPSLALLLFMIPVMQATVGRGTGPAPAIAALFLYSLLPIVRNTHAGLAGIPGPLRESAEALGLPAWAVLWRVELPLAMGTILAGVKTAAVLNVGTATLGGFIGAGGYGETIFSGIANNNVPRMLEGAVPAAVLALAVQGLFGLAERRAA